MNGNDEAFMRVALEEAARSLGSTWLYSFRRVVLPMVLPGVVSGSLLAFVSVINFFATRLTLSHAS